jgi:hypothetical protein
MTWLELLLGIIYTGGAAGVVYALIYCDDEFEGD